MAHLDEHKLLSYRQHTFKKNRSCETQLIIVINDWAKILDTGGQVDTFILDFEKAFDTPPHKPLKCKLHGYGISGKTLVWIDSFLFNRSQWCKLAMDTCFVWCAARHCSRFTVVFFVYK